MMLYATQFISLATLDYRAVWWRLFHSPNSSSWPNALALGQLLFSLPVSNGKLERIFSVLKLIKINRRSSLGNNTLKDLLMLNTNGISMQNFNPDPCIELWWQAKTRRPDQKKRKECKKKGGQNIESELRTAVMMRQFCWMIGWITPKYDLCTIGHAAHYLTTNTMIMCTIIKLM